MIGTLIIALSLILLATLLAAYGSLFLKKGSKGRLKLKELIKNYPLILGLSFYGFSTVPFLIALKFVDLSVAYPITSLSYVWVILLSKKYLKEKIKKLKLAGIMFIILGVVLIGLSAK